MGWNRKRSNSVFNGVVCFEHPSGQMTKLSVPSCSALIKYDTEPDFQIILCGMPRLLFLISFMSCEPQTCKNFGRISFSIPSAWGFAVTTNPTDGTLIFL